MTLTLLTLALTPDAHAFCGTYIGPADARLENASSLVVVARQEGWTTLTLANDYDGDVTDFALVMPVPEVLDAEDVTVPDPEVLTALDAYTAPRAVEYTCESWGWSNMVMAADSSAMRGAGGGPSEPPDVNGVTVESSFTAGSYEVEVLSARGAGGLMRWLEDHGFALSEAAEPLLADYIEADQYFLTARVRLDELVPGTLPPLQLRYPSALWSLPIRLGTAVSPGEQELVLIALTPPEDGRVGIANYVEAEVEDECMMAPGADAASWYADRLTEAFAGEAVWVTEYAWDMGWCDPCAADAPPAEQLEEVGVVGYTPFVTRLRLRYTPEEVDADLALYAAGDRTQDQVRYILHNPQLEGLAELCEGWEPEGTDECPPQDRRAPGICGFQSAAGAAWLLGLIALGLRRRRSM